MVIQYSRLNVADNSGAKIVEVINTLGVGAKKDARVGDKVRVTIKKAMSTMTPSLLLLNQCVPVMLMLLYTTLLG